MLDMEIDKISNRSMVFEALSSDQFLKFGYCLKFFEIYVFI